MVDHHNGTYSVDCTIGATLVGVVSMQVTINGGAVSNGNFNVIEP